MRSRILFASILGGLLSFCSFSATAEDLKPKLPDNVVPSAFRAFLVTDGRFPNSKTPDGKELIDPRNRTGKIHCLVCENGLAPVIAIFVKLDANGTAALKDSGLADLLIKTNRMISLPHFRAHKLASFVMFLRLQDGTKEVTVKSVQEKSEVETKVKVDLEYPDEDDLNRVKYVDDIKNYATTLNVPNIPFGLAADKSRALEDWYKLATLGMTDEDKKVEAGVTVVLYYRMRKVNAWRFKDAASLKEEDVTKILKETEAVMTDKK
jgi:hypothetical protein